MIRLSRGDRKRAIKSAIAQLNTRGKHKMHTKGEICRKMGIKSSSKIRIILEEMERDGEIVGATTALDNFSFEIAIYGLPTYEQIPLPSHTIQINGVTMFMMHGAQNA